MGLLLVIMRRSMCLRDRCACINIFLSCGFGACRSRWWNGHREQLY
uniref:Uncharacterized protein n=1 Tax=Zea mays TaxID=4577 RepID=B4FVW5_MAIZE|nr:unknown [Zea mays]